MGFVFAGHSLRKEELGRWSRPPRRRRRRFRLRERSRRLGPTPLWCHGAGTRKHDDEPVPIDWFEQNTPPFPLAWFVVSRPCCSSNKTAAGGRTCPAAGHRVELTGHGIRLSESTTASWAPVDRWHGVSRFCCAAQWWCARLTRQPTCERPTTHNSLSQRGGVPVWAHGRSGGWESPAAGGSRRASTGPPRRGLL